MQTLEYRKQIDGLRFFAFLAVFMIHSDVEHFWWGSYGVSLFFVISGFLITRILIASQDRPRAQTLKIFYARRALRIFPAYYLVLGLAAATVGIAYLPAYVLYVMNWGIFFYTWIQPALVDRPWDPVRMYGVHFWSLCVEEQFYLLFPLLFSSLRPGRARLRWLLALWAACIAFRFLFAVLLPKSAYGLIPLVCGEYLIAGCGCQVFAEGRGRRTDALPPGNGCLSACAGSGTFRAVWFGVTVDRPCHAPAACKRCWRWLPRCCWDCGKRTIVGC
jgi:peptidoglycan/LPS O-acetylase OafA/YrhL